MRNKNLLQNSGETRLLVAFCYWIIIVCFLAGCTSGGNDPIVASTKGEGGGYNIQMTSSVQTVPPDGTALISAAVFKPDGNPIKDGEEVTFSSNLEGTFEGLTDGKAKTKNGVATAIYKFTQTVNADKPQPSRANRIFASYLGALSYVEITLVSSTF